jgi:hypothetical protein
MSRAGTNLGYIFEMIDDESHSVRAIRDAELLEGFPGDVQNDTNLIC